MLLMVARAFSIAPRCLADERRGGSDSGPSTGSHAGDDFGKHLRSIPRAPERQYDEEPSLDLTAEQSEFLTTHQWATLATGRKDGSPQVSMIGYAFDGAGVVVTFRRTSAKAHNISRQPQVALLVADGRRALTLYGDARILETDPERVAAFETLLTSFGAPASPREDLSRNMDDEGRIAVRISLTSADLHD
jgi:PPOX class probable F420-dependent enzyme